jgi:hypothetical protein
VIPSPGLFALIAVVASSAVEMALPSIAVMTSPASTPAPSAGERLRTDATRAPSEVSLSDTPR